MDVVVRSAVGALAALLTLLSASSSVALAQAEGAAALSGPASSPSRTELPSVASSTYSPVHVEVLAGTTAPIDFGATASLVLFDHFVLGGGLGVGVYSNLLTGIARAAGGDPGATLVSPLATRPFVARAFAGLRPFGAAGFEITVGYVRIHSAATLDGTSLASELGVQLPLSTVDANLTLHAVHVELGWTVRLFDRLLIRPALGWLSTFSSDVQLSSAAATAAYGPAVLTAASQTLSAAIPRYARSPTLSLSIGFRF